MVQVRCWSEGSSPPILAVLTENTVGSSIGEQVPSTSAMTGEHRCSDVMEVRFTGSTTE